MRKILALTLALVMVCSTMVACGDTSSSTTDSSKATTADKDAAGATDQTTPVDESAPASASSTADELKAPVSDSPIDVAAGATENMLTRSILNEGDTSRLAEKVNNALVNNKDMTTVAFLGDSITAGSAASSNNQYTKQFVSWWEENISFYIDPINAGIGATDSYLAVHRVDTDVLAKNPDIIFIEFINDVDDDFYKSCMDSLIRKCMAAENNPAVVLVEMTMEDGTCPQRVHSEIGLEYNIPIISYHDAILPEVQAGTIEWSAISPDNIHPNDAGHVILSQLLTNFVGGIKDNIDTLDKVSKPFEAESPTGDVFKNASIADRTNLTATDEGAFTRSAEFWPFTDGWETVSGGSITFEMEFQNLGMLYMKRTDNTCGIAKITIDGEEIMSVDGDFAGGWGNYANNDKIYTSDAPAKHTVTVTVEDGDKQMFTILKWLLS